MATMNFSVPDCVRAAFILRTVEIGVALAFASPTIALPRGRLQSADPPTSSDTKRPWTRRAVRLTDV